MHFVRVSKMTRCVWSRLRIVSGSADTGEVAAPGDALCKPLVPELYAPVLVSGTGYWSCGFEREDAGRYFSVGGNIKGMQSGRPGGDVVKEGAMLEPGTGRRIIQNILDCDKPIVCAINGDCIGLAATVALFCDITVASETARIGDPHVKVGLVAGDGGAVIWPMLIGPCQGQPKFPQVRQLNSPHPVHDSVVSSARTRPALSFSLSR